MRTTRREFMGKIGVALASLLVARCRPAPTPTCYVAMPLTPTPTIPLPTCYEAPAPTPEPSAQWQPLRSCWFDLDDPRLQSFEDNEFITDLRQRHADALDALVAAGELDPAVADEIAVAFEQAIAHVQRQMATCYIALPPEYMPRQDLVQQAAALEEMAARSDVDPNTVAQAQAALERDLAWLAQFQAGQTPDPLFSIEVPPESAEAARILVNLLLGE